MEKLREKINNSVAKKIILNENSIVFLNEEIEYKNISSFVVKNSFFLFYKFEIYEANKEKPSLKFKIKDTNIAVAISDYLNFKLGKKVVGYENTFAGLIPIPLKQNSEMYENNIRIILERREFKEFKMIKNNFLNILLVLQIIIGLIILADFLSPLISGILSLILTILLLIYIYFFVKFNTNQNRPKQL